MARLINGAITEILDPNIYFSRFSFLESGKEAIDLKFKLGKKSLTGNDNSLPNVKNKYYTRSSLVKNLVPFPSEGKVRAMFSDGQRVSLPKIIKPRMNTSKSPQKNYMIGDVSHKNYYSEVKYNQLSLNKSPMIKSPSG